MKAFIFFSLVAVAFADQCGENEHFESCGTSCPLTCNNRYNPPRACNLRCNIGCQCDDGYVRNEANGRCVKLTDCPPPKCGKNEHFESCGTACPLTCNNYFNPPRFCILRCDIGCQCDAGYVRNKEDRRCVKPKDCPKPKCGTNERFETCGTSCPLTCENYKDAPLPCVFKCDIGCHCEEGYVRNSENKCVRPEDCTANSEAASAPEACLQDKEMGLCDAYFPRYYFNKESGQCERFVYGGCGGNSNNFATKEECEAVCQS